MTKTATYDSEWSKIVAAGGHVHLYAESSKALYIHAKVISADAGLSDAKIYVGSINFSAPSMDDNRELGVSRRSVSRWYADWQENRNRALAAAGRTARCRALRSVAGAAACADRVSRRPTWTDAAAFRPG
jgi:phosphatidylserine/phosphatidylglycerophosphate/cardiolipin synthase-like enzyme